MASNNNQVICPNCCHEFTAIPVSIQQEIARLRAGIEALAYEAWWPHDARDIREQLRSLLTPPATADEQAASKDSGGAEERN